MKIDAKYKPELCVSSDVTRPHIGNVQLETDKRRMVATNGHMAIVVPVEVEDKDHTGPVPPEALKAARKLAGKHGDVAFSANGAITLANGATFPRVETFPFPPIDRVIPEYRKGSAGTLTIGLDAKLLLTLAEALGAGNKSGAQILLTIQLPTTPGEDMLDPYVVTANTDGAEAIGVLMPCRTR